MLGRQHELDLASEVLAGEHPCGLLLSGPFGCGRSRLLAEIARLAEAEGVDVVTVAGSPGGFRRSLLPLLTLLDGSLPTSVDTDSLVRRLWSSLARKSARQPVAIVVDNLEGLDQDSLVFLYQVATQHLAKVIGAVRSDTDRLPEIEGALPPPAFRLREVPDLTDEESGCLVRLAFGDELNARDKEQVVLACGGRPRILAGIVESFTDDRNSGGRARAWPPAPYEPDVRHFKQALSGMQADVTALVALTASLGELPGALLREVCPQALEAAAAARLVASDCDRVRPAHVVVSVAARATAIETDELSTKLIAAVERRPVGDLDAAHLRGRIALGSGAPLDPARALVGARAASLLGRPQEAIRMLEGAWTSTCDGAIALMRDLLVSLRADARPETILTLGDRPSDGLALLAAVEQRSLLAVFADLAHELLAPEAAATLLESLGEVSRADCRPYVAVRHAGALVALERYTEAADEARDHTGSDQVEVAGTALSVTGLVCALRGDVVGANAAVERLRTIAVGVSDPAAVLTGDTAIRAGLASALAAALVGCQHPPVPTPPSSNTWFEWFLDVRDRVLSSLLEGMAAEPETVPEQVLPWWPTRMRYLAAAGAGGLVAALPVARAVAERDAQGSVAPALTLLTLHDTLRMGDISAAHLIKELLARSGRSFAELPFCRAALRHALGVIADDHEQLREAAWLFDEVSATQQAHELQRLIAGHPVQPFGGPDRDGDGIGASEADRLTPREREVATLAAAGLPNRAIASRLSVSHRTVENQLSRAYAKLGICGRHELTGALRN